MTSKPTTKTTTNRPNSNITDRVPHNENDPLDYARKRYPRYRAFRVLVESQGVALPPSLTLTSVVAAAHQRETIGAFAMDLNVSNELARTLIDDLELDDVLTQQSLDSETR